MLITLEGVDGTGKSTLAQKLLAETDRDDALLTKEPGTTDFVPYELEAHLNCVRFFIWAAYYMRAGGNVLDDAGSLNAGDRALLAALSLLSSYDLNSETKRWLLRGGNPPKEVKHMAQAYQAMSIVIEGDHSLRSRLERQGRRGAVRQALMHATDSSSNPPTVAGLLFFANHFAHQLEVVEPALESEALVISDRYAESQLAYGPVFGCDSVVEDLYARYNRCPPDHTVLLTALPQTISERISSRSGVDADKQSGKSWAKLKLFGEAQDQYRHLASTSGPAQTWHIISTEDKSPGEIAEEAKRSIGLS